MALIVRIKPRAERQIEAAALWWSENRSAVPGAVRKDLEPALATLADHPGIGTKVEGARDPGTRKLYLARTKYFVYYRPKGQHLDVVAFWHSSREHGPRV